MFITAEVLIESLAGGDAKGGGSGVGKVIQAQGGSFGFVEVNANQGSSGPEYFDYLNGGGRVYLNLLNENFTIEDMELFGDLYVDVSCPPYRRYPNGNIANIGTIQLTNSTNHTMLYFKSPYAEPMVTNPSPSISKN